MLRFSEAGRKTDFFTRNRIAPTERREHKEVNVDLPCLYRLVVFSIMHRKHYVDVKVFPKDQ